MAAEEVEYESDPEEAKMSLKMRRRVASDDEEEVEAREKPLRRVDSDVESDGQGAAPAEYDDEDEEEVEDEEVEEYLEEEEESEERAYEEDGLGRKGEGRVLGHSQVVETVVEGEGGKEWGGEILGTEVSTEADGRGSDGVDENGEGTNDPQQRDAEEKKENEPYAVPTAGAFYMHDDRFRENLGGRQRRTLGGRKLWESRDDRKWGHDKFEELTSRGSQYEEGRKSSRGRFRGRGRSRGAGRGYSQGNRPKTYENNNNQNNNNDQNDASKSVRGRGPRRYQPSFKNNDAPFTQNKQSGKLVEKSSWTSSGRTPLPNSDVDSGVIPTNRQVFASSLSSASPPFYPSGSSSKESTQKRDVQAGTANRNIQAPVVDETFSMAQPNTMMRGKNVVDSIGLDKLYIDDATSGVAGKPSTTSQFAPSGSSSVNSSQSQHVRAQGRGLNTLPGMTYQPISTSNLVNRVSPPTQLHGAQRYSVQSRVQPSSRQFAQRPGSASQASSPTKATVAVNSVESGELESPSELSKSKTSLVGKGKVNVQGSGRNPFLYGGTQVMGPSGNMSTGHGDQNFPAAPTFLPVMQLGGQQVMQLGGQQVMQLGGQHPGGIGVPAVGMAFPGYVGNPQLGLGNSEMTWLPVLAGAAGALGASYCSPYIAVDGAYHALPSGQASALPAASSKENNTNKPSNEGKSSQRPEHANDDLGQRQKNPRRYTEMKFDQ